MGFSLEPSEPFLISGKGFRKDFDRDFAAELGVAGTVDLSHTARTNRGKDLVTT